MFSFLQQKKKRNLKIDFNILKIRFQCVTKKKNWIFRWNALFILMQTLFDVKYEMWNEECEKLKYDNNIGNISQHLFKCMNKICSKPFNCNTNFSPFYFNEKKKNEKVQLMRWVILFWRTLYANPFDISSIWKMWM